MNEHIAAGKRIPNNGGDYMPSYPTPPRELAEQGALKNESPEATAKKPSPMRRLRAPSSAAVVKFFIGKPGASFDEVRDALAGRFSSAEVAAALRSAVAVGALAKDGENDRYSPTASSLDAISSRHRRRKKITGDCPGSLDAELESLRSVMLANRPKLESPANAIHMLDQLADMLQGNPAMVATLRSVAHYLRETHEDEI